MGMTDQLDSVGIVGAGRMGSTIAVACAVAGFPVILCSRRSEDIVRQQLLARLQKRYGDDPVRVDSAQSQISVARDLVALRTVDIAIECVPEDIDAKAAVLSSLREYCLPHAVLASNTSSLSIRALAKMIGVYDRVIGLHFFNPADAMELVELVTLPETSPGTVDRVALFVRALGKSPITVPDTPGFIVNRILFAMLCEALRVYEEGLVPPDLIDVALRMAANLPVGPLALADQIGLDVCLSVLKNLSGSLGERYAPPRALCEAVAAGRLGRKSGGGLLSL
jgi:3-hydroxybutyryl-CoA dehydrogenase